MDEEEKSELINSLEGISKDTIMSPFQDKPELERELLIGQLRTSKEILKKAQRKKLTDEALNVELDKYNIQRAKYLKEIDEKGLEYTEGEEDSDDYKSYAL